MAEKSSRSSTSRPSRADSSLMRPRNRCSRVGVPADVGLQQARGVAPDGRQRGAQLVGEPGQEGALELLELRRAMASRRARSDASRSRARRRELAASSSSAVWSTTAAPAATSGPPGPPVPPGAGKRHAQVPLRRVPGREPRRARPRSARPGGAWADWIRAADGRPIARPEPPPLEAEAGRPRADGPARRRPCRRQPRHTSGRSPTVAVNSPTSSAPRPARSARSATSRPSRQRQRSGQGFEHLADGLEDAVSRRELAEQPVPLDGAGGIAGVQGHQVELVPGGAPGAPAQDRDHPGHPAGAGEGDAPGAADAAPAGLVAVRLPTRVPPRRRRSPPPPPSRRPARSGRRPRRRDLSARPRPAARQPDRAGQAQQPPVPDVDAEAFVFQGGAEGGQDERQAGRRLGRRQVVGEAVQAAQLAAGRRRSSAGPKGGRPPRRGGTAQARPRPRPGRG